MITANELRIGNWIHNPIQGINFQVDLATIGNVMRDNDKRNKVPDYSLYKPIPITEEIILKCGFDKNSYYYIHKKTYFIFTFGLGLCYINIDSMFESFSRDETKHLHQLQNLYFAITGEELEVSL